MCICPRHHLDARMPTCAPSMSPGRYFWSGELASGIFPLLKETPKFQLTFPLLYRVGYHFQLPFTSMNTSLSQVSSG